jgi:phosphoribosylformimino-5-aminoimidazole carboxamide ribotide isomerase
LALRFEDAGVAAIIYTDISRDGAMEGPNVEATKALAEEISTPVIVSGGVSSMADLKVLKDASDDLFEGVISGRAVYDGKIDPGVATHFLKG